MIWYWRKHLWMHITYIQYRQKYGISGKHNGNTRIFRFVLVEMAWCQPKMMDVIDEKCNLQSPKLKIHIRIHRDVSFFQTKMYVFNNLFLASCKICDRSPGNIFWALKQNERKVWLLGQCILIFKSIFPCCWPCDIHKTLHSHWARAL